jgi:hypothetical protein
MKKLFYSLFFFLTLALCSCNDSIRDIRENRSKFLNKDVKLEVVVGNKIPFMEFYKVKDETGEIWLKSSEDNLNKNQKYTIKGKVREIKNLLIDEIYIEENKK